MVPAIALALCAMATLPWSVQPYWDALPDSAQYLLAARSLGRGEGYAIAGAPFTLRPPGFSALLLPVVAWRGIDFPALNLLVSGLGIVAVVLFFLLLRRHVPTTVAWVAAAALWLNPQIQLLCNQVLSDVPSLAGVLLVFLLAPWATGGSARRAVALGCVAAAALYVRTANLVLLPALAAEAMFSGQALAATPPASRARAIRRRLLAVAVAALLYLPWVAYAARVPDHRGAHPELRNYGTAFLRMDRFDPDSPWVDAGELVRRLKQNLPPYAALLGSALTNAVPTRRSAAAAALALAALLIVLARRREGAEWFAGLSLAMILIYFAWATRLLLPVFVIAYKCAIELAWWLGRRAGPRRAVEGAMVTGLVLMALATFRADFMTPGSRDHYQHLLSARDHIEGAVDSRAVVAADLGAVFSVLLDRPVLSLRTSCRHLGAERTYELLRAREAAVMAFDSTDVCAPLGAYVTDVSAVQAFGRYRVVRLAVPAGTAR